jgi:hypothetical protein
MTSPNELKRPRELEFALEFCGNPEETIARQYIEALEARAALAQPEPEPEGLPPGYIDTEISGRDREMLEAFYKACRSEGGTADEITLRGLKAALTRHARPAIQPVPVAEHPWERKGWRDAEGICWWFHKATPDTNAGWIPATHEDIELVGAQFFSYSLPHHALPVPGAEVG